MQSIGHGFDALETLYPGGPNEGDSPGKNEKRVDNESVDKDVTGFGGLTTLDGEILTPTTMEELGEGPEEEQLEPAGQADPHERITSLFEDYEDLPSTEPIRSGHPHTEDEEDGTLPKKTAE